MIKRFGIVMIKYIVLVIAMAVVGLLLLCLVYLIPTERIAENACRANEGSWEPSEYLVDGMNCTYINNYTDALMLNTASCPGEGTLINRALGTYSYSFEEDSFRSFKRFCTGEEGYTLLHYARYWNGYLIFLKPLLLFLDYYKIRIINLICSSVLLIFSAIRIGKSSAHRVTFAFVLSIISMIPIVMSIDMLYCGVYYILLISSAITVSMVDRGSRKINYLMLVIGAVTTYIDILAFPLVTMVYPLVLIEIAHNNESVSERIRRVVSNAWAWGCGYIGLWGLKWILATIGMKENILGDAAGEILFRTSETTISGEKVSRLNALGINISDYFSVFSLGCIAVFIIVMLSLVLLKHYTFAGVQDKGIFVVLIGIMLFPVIWLMLKANHSFIHHWMTHRELSGSLFAILAAMTMFVKKRV